MRFERLYQILRGLRWSYPLEIKGWQATVDRAKWRLWHGQVERADQALGELAADLDPRLGPATPAWSSPPLRLRSALGEVQAYLRANAAGLVDYARRYLRGQRISTAVVESMVNRVIGRRMAKKQPMRSQPPWRPPARPNSGGRAGRLPGASISAVVSAL